MNIEQEISNDEVELTSLFIIPEQLRYSSVKKASRYASGKNNNLYANAVEA